MTLSILSLLKSMPLQNQLFGFTIGIELATRDLKMQRLDLMDSYQRLVISSSWKHYMYLLDMLEDNSDEDLQDLDEGHQEIIQKLKNFDKGSLSTSSRDFVRFLPGYRPALMNSHFCASYALFEYQLTWLCNIAQSIHENPFSVDDIKPSSIDRFKNYLKKLGIAFPNSSLKWSEIKCYQRIRNKIMHAGATVGSNWNHFDYAKDEGIIDVDRNQLALTRPFCERAANDFEGFALTVSKSIVINAESKTE